MFFPSDVFDDCALCVGSDDPDVDRMLLTEPIEAANRLIELFVTVGKSEEDDVVTVLPVHSETGDFRFCDDFGEFSGSEIQHGVRFELVAVSAANVHHAGTFRRDGFGFGVEITPYAELIGIAFLVFADYGSG